MCQESVTIIDRENQSAEIDAILETNASLVHLLDAESTWGPVRLRVLREILLGNSNLPVPGHAHWYWPRKIFDYDHSDPQRYRLFLIQTAEEIQGLMWVWMKGRLARLAPDIDQPLVYVDYIETAPWNAREYTLNPRYGGVGTQLLKAAVRKSVSKNCEGRVGLHSLPGAERFYAEACGMQNLGSDPGYHNLVYFEFTSEAARLFIEE